MIQDVEEVAVVVEDWNCEWDVTIRDYVLEQLQNAADVYLISPFTLEELGLVFEGS